MLLPLLLKSIINKQVNTLLRQIRTENAVKDLVRSNRRMGIVVPKSVKVSSCSHHLHQVQLPSVEVLP